MKRLARPRIQRFNGKNGMTVRLRGEQHTGRHQLAIEQHRTRAAFAALTAVLDAPHAGAPQKRHQSFVGRTIEGFGLAVEEEVNVHWEIWESYGIAKYGSECSASVVLLHKRCGAKSTTRGD